MSHDEVEHGDEAEPGRSYGWYVIIAVAIVVALVSMLGRHHASSAGPTTPLPTLSPLPGPAATSSAAPASTAPAITDPPTTPAAAVLEGPPGLVEQGAVCRPIQLTPTSLSVSFLLLNPTAHTEKLVSIAERLPMGGLKPQGTYVRSGTCTAIPGALRKPAGLVLKPGNYTIVVMNFGLPDSCPQPVPVGATVVVTGSQGPIVNSLPVFGDLGDVQFENCPSSAAG